MNKKKKRETNVWKEISNGRVFFFLKWNVDIANIKREKEKKKKR